MSIFADRSTKRFFAILAAVLFTGVITAQIVASVNALQFKNELLAHDYALAGNLMTKHPELASAIRAAFKADKPNSSLIAGKILLQQAGYNESVQQNLIPRVNAFYQTSAATNLISSLVISLAIFLTVYWFLKSHYKRIEEYNKDIVRIMDGKVSTRLNDNEEGSLAKLASSTNALITVLHTHLEKEKNSRVFLKELLTNISHQLKTPLSALTMYTEIMRNEKTDNEVIAGFLNRSENELERMETLIANLLKLARLDAGIIELKIKEYVLNDLVKQAVGSFETRLINEHKTLRIEAQGEISYPCDREWLLEALSNLIKNAVEHITAGKQITVLLEENPLMVKVSVRDDGEGIHPDDVHHVFKRFYRSRFSQNKQGTGIGLTLAKTIIEMHGGFISVESTVHQGSVFTVHLPRLTKL